jgi:hypothetical protein
MIRLVIALVILAAAAYGGYTLYKKFTNPVSYL